MSATLILRDHFFRRHAGREAVQSVHRQCPRDEGCVLGHGSNFLFSKPGQPAVFAAARARAHSAEERQTWRPQSSRPSWPEDRQHPRDLYEQRDLETRIVRSDRLAGINSRAVQRVLWFLVVVIFEWEKRNSLFGLNR